MPNQVYKLLYLQNFFNFFLFFLFLFLFSLFFLFLIFFLFLLFLLLLPGFVWHLCFSACFLATKAHLLVGVAYFLCWQSFPMGFHRKTKPKDSPTWTSLRSMARWTVVTPSIGWGSKILEKRSLRNSENVSGFLRSLREGCLFMSQNVIP